MAHKEDLLQRPLYIYHLPPEILSTLSVKSDPTPAELQSLPEIDNTSSISSDTSATNCGLCSFTGNTVQEQRAHVRSDHHKLNMKRKIRGQRALSEAEFEKTLADIEEGESISGSEYSESEPDAEADGDFSAATRKKRGINPVSNSRKDYNDDEVEADNRNEIPRTPWLWCKASVLPSTVSLGIYRALLPADTTDYPAWLITKQLQPTPNPPANPPHFFLCMIGGGHFAAMIISLIPQASHKPGERAATVLAHKTFHRYTTRRKQGGAQSANDAAKGNAHSAGSNLRRYNEAELTKDIRELLASWKSEWIDTAELMFVRAAGTANRRTIFHYDGAVLNSRDPRIRGFPFSTRRATQGELMRAFLELTRVKVSRATTVNVAVPTTNPRPEQPQQTSGPRTLKPTAAERMQLDHTSTVISLIRRSKVPPLLTYLSANSLSPNFLFYPRAQHFHAPTPLHLAASVSAPAIVSALLTKLEADPTVKNDEGKTPFDFAGDRPTRDAFRLARSELGEERWDWSAAKVPSPLTPADIAARTEAEALQKQAREEREATRRKNEVARLKKEEQEKEAREKRSAALRGDGGVKLGGAGGAQRLRTGDDLGREREAAGMTPEMRMRLERERRARAAEARMRAMQGGGSGGGN